MYIKWTDNKQEHESWEIERDMNGYFVRYGEILNRETPEWKKSQEKTVITMCGGVDYKRCTLLRIMKI